MQTELFEWLDEKERERFLNDSQLAERAKISPSMISKARQGHQDLTWDACVKIADALHVPPLVVLVKAGYLKPPDDGWDAETEELVRMFANVSESDRAEILLLLRHKLENKLSR